MPTSTIPALRLASHRLSGPPYQNPAAVVAGLGAVQAQDYGQALWAIGCRLPAAQVETVEQAVLARAIVRTWPMRRTLHFVPAADARWMVSLLTPRVIAAAKSRMHLLELTEAMVQRAEKALIKALQGRPPQARESLMAALEAAGISTASQRGVHIVARLAMEGLLCCGPRAGKQQTIVLLDEWLPRARTPGREEALATLAHRFFRGHGPATLSDFVWWTGLKVADARAAVDFASAQLERHREEGVDYWHALGTAPGDDSLTAHLLPAYDEFLLGYKDRRHVIESVHARKIVPGGNGIFLPMVVANGRIIGTWKRNATEAAVRVALQPFGRVDRRSLQSLAQAACAYGEFLHLRGALHAEKRARVTPKK